MNDIQHLLVKLMEEAAEIQQAVSKALCFGLEDGYPDSDTTNLEDIEREFNDLLAIVEMLNERGVLFDVQHAQIEAKKAKVLEWMAYAKKQGTLQL